MKTLVKKNFLIVIIAAIFLLTIVPTFFGWYDSYIQLIIQYIGINIILTVSLNLINGYMGEFNCGHAGFMGAGAYIASIVTVALLVQDDVFGPPILSEKWSFLIFPISLVMGAIGAAIFGLLVAIPSFRTRGDYLAIITLAVNYIFKSFIENMQKIGGARGFMGTSRVVMVMEKQLPVPWTMIYIFIATIFTVFVVKQFTTSTLGKSVMAIREDEIASELMTINTRRVKVIAFMLACGLAGLAGGLYAHVIGYINPGGFTILKSAEVMVMVYLGGMASISGSILSATGFTVALELLKPLGLFRWVLLPLLLIVIMLFRPTGLMGNRELTDVFPRLKSFLSSEEKVENHVPASD
jgi:branched-chain amino acid transport system permease protein